MFEKFEGTANQIENNSNKTQIINENSTGKEYPSAKAVFDFSKKWKSVDQTYDPTSANAQSGIAVAEAIDKESTKYFDITAEGMVFLKREYRGAYNEDGETANPASNVPYGISDNGEGKIGSKNFELPSEIIIPNIVNGIKVVSVADGMFAYNRRVKRIVLCNGITKISNAFAYKAWNCEAIENTEQITSDGAYAFAYTKLTEINMPNLTTRVAPNAFRNCAYLKKVNIGKITRIWNKAFANAEKLEEIKIANPVTRIDYGAFWGCLNLRSVDNLLKAGVTTQIENRAFLYCRPSYDWANLTGCKFETTSLSGDKNVYKGYNDSTSLQLNPTDFWTGATFTPRTNKALSFLNQSDERWRDEKMGVSTYTFSKGCAFFSVMGAYCSLNDIEIDDARDFIDICESKGIDMSQYRGDLNHSFFIDMFNKLGLNCEAVTAPLTVDKVQTMYDAIANGKYLVIRVLSSPEITKDDEGNVKDGYTGHAIAITGVYSKGELIIQDSGSATRLFDYFAENKSGEAPIQNILRNASFEAGTTVAFILSKGE